MSTRLGLWLETHGITQSEFAPRVRISKAQLSRIIGNKSYPSVNVAQRIVKETKGAVGFADLFSPRGAENAPVDLADAPVITISSLELAG